MIQTHLRFIILVVICRGLFNSVRILFIEISPKRWYFAEVCQYFELAKSILYGIPISSSQQTQQTY